MNQLQKKKSIDDLTTSMDDALSSLGQMVLHYTAENLIQHTKEKMMSQIYVIRQISSNYDEFDRKMGNLLKDMQKINEKLTKCSSPQRRESTSLFSKELNQDPGDEFTLALKEPLPKMTYRNRKLKIQIQLMHQGKIFENINSIPIEIMIFTYDDPPRQICFNNKGGPIVCGNLTTTLLGGRAVFDRIFFQEISGHFPKNKFKLVVAPLHCLTRPKEKQQSRKFVDSKLIKPLHTADLQVKSKKLGKKSE